MTCIWVDVEQGTDEWHTLRRFRLGSSDSYTIMEINPFKGEDKINTPYKLWEHIKNGRPKQIEANYAMKRGTALEPIARAKYEEAIGMAMLPAVAINIARDWQISSFDGVSADRKRAVEIKCGGAVLHAMAKRKEVPAYYYCQIQHHYAAAEEIELIDYCSYYEGDLQFFPVYKDEAYIQKLLKAEEQFYNCIVTDTAPELMDEDFVQLEVDSECLALSEEWKDLTRKVEEIEKFEKRRNEIKSILVAKTEGKNSLLNGIRLRKVDREGSIDYARIPELKGVDTSQYKKPKSSYWTMKLKPD